MVKQDEDFIKRMINKYGKEIMITDFSLPEGISTDSVSLDASIGVGGIPRAKITEIYGPEGCSSFDTFIQYEVKMIGGKSQNRKGGTIARLYDRFHKITTPGQGFYNRKISENSIFYVSSINEKNCIIKNLVVDVVKSGIKKCYKVISGKYSIETTLEHQYYIGNGKYKKLEDIVVGDIIYIHDNFTNKKEIKNKKKRKSICIKYHTNGSKTTVNNCIYYKIRYSKFVFESYANGYSLDEYRKILNTESKEFIDSLYHIPLELDVHHIDMNPSNNSIENLALKTKQEHYSDHAKESIENLSFIVKPFIIDSIEYVGEKETYDIKCLYPYNNYIANKFVVHNSAKTTIMLHVAKNAIKKNYGVLYIDVENLLDMTYAHNLIGGESDKFTVMQPDTAEDAFTIAEQGIESGEFPVIIFDSIGALAPKKEKEDEFEDQNVALVPRLMSKFIRRNEYAIRTKNIAFIFTNQVRDNVGSYTQGYNTPGGHALKHIATVIIQLGKGTPIKVGDEQIGAMVTFTIKKNKLAPPFRSFTIPIIYGKGVDIVRDLVTFGESMGILSKAGPYIKYGEINLGRGMNDVSTNLMLPESKALYEGIRQKILDSVKKYNHPLTEAE